MQKNKTINHLESEEKHPKQDFQVERIAFLSDAIFAIAITLLIIEFKIPHISNESTYESVLKDLISLKNNFFALLLSFFLIASYWIQHHFLFKHLHNYNNEIIIANFFMMLPIILFPFTTAFLAESSENSDVIRLSLQIFLANNILAGLTTYYLYWLATSKHKEFSFDITREEKFKFFIDILFKTLTFIFIFIVTLFTNQLSIIFWPAIIFSAIRKLLIVYEGKKYIKK